MLSKCESHKITKNGAELLIYRRPYPKETATRIIYGCRMSSNHKEISRTQLRAWEFANCSLEVTRMTKKSNQSLERTAGWIL